MFKLYITIKNKYWIINNKFFWTPHFISRFYEFTDYYPCSLIWGWEQCFWCRSSLYWGWSKYLGEGEVSKRGDPSVDFVNCFDKEMLLKTCYSSSNQDCWPYYCLLAVKKSLKGPELVDGSKVTFPDRLDFLSDFFRSSFC